MLRTILSLSFALLILIYFGYQNYQTKKEAQSEIKQLHKVIELKEKELNFYQKVNEKATTEKLQLQNKSDELTEKLKDALKNKTCSDEPISDFISNKLYQRAYQIRRISENTIKSSH